LATITILSKGVSDHNPLMLKFGDRLQIKDPMLKFEKWWLEVEEFARIVKKCWGTDCPSRDPLEVWQFKVRLLRRKLKS
jgi:hypothetical protein